MNAHTHQGLVDKIADAVLYEGYILYPYRASTVKNRQRFSFGGLYPPAYSQAQAGTDACAMQTECLVSGTRHASLDVRVRFLHLAAREIGRLATPQATLPADVDEQCEKVDALKVGDRHYQAWQEAVEREVTAPGLCLETLARQSHAQAFSFPPSCVRETLRDASGSIVGVLSRRQEAISGLLEVTATALDDSLFKVRVSIANDTRFDAAESETRESALLRSLASTHSILQVHAGEFVSLIDPPAAFRQVAAECRQRGAWPVLVGEEGRRDTLLCSPIILYDYPQIAPESPGDLCDGTEIDEILLLRIMTLTEDEKREMRCVDPRAREILERAELMPSEQLWKLHGALRGLPPAREVSR